MRVEIGITIPGATRGAALTPPLQSSIRFWGRGDDPAASINTTPDPDQYNSVPNAGTIGGSFAQATSANQPQYSVVYSGKAAPLFGSIAACRLPATSGAGSCDFMHSPTGVGTVTARFRLTSVAATYVLFGTYGGAPANRGFIMGTSGGGATIARFGNGSGSDSALIVSSGVTVAINTDYTMQVVKNATAVTVYLDGTSVASGTLTSASASASTNAPTWGGGADGGASTAGWVPEVVVHEAVLDATQLATMRNYVARWSYTGS